MKKIVSFIIVVMLLSMSFSASAEIEFLFEPMTNYTEDCTVKMTFDSSRELVSLLEELQLAEQFEAFADVEKFLETLLSVDGKVFIQADIGEDLKKARIAITADGFNAVDFNKNLQINVTSKTGLWMVYDFTDADNPVYEIVYSLPFMNKYVHMNIFEIMPEEEKQQFIDSITTTLSKEKIDEIKQFMLALYEEHADIKVSFSKVTIKLDNTGLVGMIEDMIPYIVSMVEPSMPEEERAAMADFVTGISFDGVQLLGKDGIVYTYNLKSGKISSLTADMDVSIDISKIYTAITGEVWEFVSSGKLDFTLKADAALSKLGSTKVELPALTEENSISLSDMMEEEMGEYYPEEEFAEPVYPNWYIAAEASNLPVINGEIYVPLRATLAAGYDDTVQIGFNDGVITAECDYFPGFKTMTLTNGSDKIYLDGAEKAVSPVIIENGTTYVSNKLFTDVFGWAFESADHYMIDNTYWYAFYHDSTDFMFDDVE